VHADSPVPVWGSFTPNMTGSQKMVREWFLPIIAQWGLIALIRTDRREGPQDMTQAFEGIFNILATPFTADGAVDTASLRRLVDFQLARVARGLTILGVLGEAAKLTLDERRTVMETVMETVNGRVPVVVGTSHEQTDSRIFRSRQAMEAGAAEVMIAP